MKVKVLPKLKCDTFGHVIKILAFTPLKSAFLADGWNAATEAVQFQILDFL